MATADRILPITASGARTAKLIKGARYVCEGWATLRNLDTHADEVNRELVGFLGKGAAKPAASVPRKEAVA
jgi:non-heme chloroperoxidase